jgi:Calcineurin-like phosphoesterase
MEAAEMPYKVMFDWTGIQYDKGGFDRLKAVSCDGQNIPEEDTTPSQIGEDFAQLTKHEAVLACVTVNDTNTIQLHRGKFLYLDVGRWLKRGQSFGLVCGSEAALCEYHPGKQFKISGLDEQQEPFLNNLPRPATGMLNKLQEPFLNNFLRTVKGVSVIKRLPIPDPHPVDPNRLYIVLPDMHVPEAPPFALKPPPLAAPPPPPTPYTAEEPGHGTPNPDYQIYVERERARQNAYWGQEYFVWSKRDSIFESRYSISAMCSFLDQVRNFKSASQVSLVQVGDMYELWAGRRCLFKETPSKSPAVELIGDTPEEQEKSATLLGSWVGRTHLLWPELFQMFDACEDAGISTAYLHGNHDSYMITSKVVEQAKEYIKTSIDQGRAEGMPPGWIETLQSTRVHERRRPCIEDGIFIEHGQRVDAFNRDGNSDGPSKTNTAVDHPSLPLKAFDPTRRKTFVFGAAAYWHRQYGNFGLYVQGHTHAPVLEYVYVYHNLGALKFVVGHGPQYDSTEPVRVLGPKTTLPDYSP